LPGYETVFIRVGDYDLYGSPESWAKVVAMRHALTLFPDCKYIWFLDQHAYIMNPSLTIENHVMNRQRLEDLMIKDLPVVPPDSIIRTFSHLRGDEVDFVLSQDRDGLSASSFVIRNGEWAEFFLDTWFNPHYRSYNFQKAETHALVGIPRTGKGKLVLFTNRHLQEHIVQWHPTILSKMAIVPQRILNAYDQDESGDKYENGDMVIRFSNCPKTGEKSCEKIAQDYKAAWQAAFKA
jgi:mannan polymerase II complex MNN11 subunit